MPRKSASEIADVRIVETALRERIQKARTTVQEFFGAVIRRAIDEVLDGPRTGYCTFDRLDGNEKAYVGTKVENILRQKLEVPRGDVLDCVIDGVETDIKWSNKNAKWMIAPENMDKVCLGLCGAKAFPLAFSVGLFVPTENRCTQGKGNRDKKRSLVAEARDHHVLWLCRDAPLPENFLATLSSAELAHIFAGPTASERNRRLLEALPMRQIPRLAIETVNMTIDPLRRGRQDADNEAALGGWMQIATDGPNAKLARALLPGQTLLKGHFLSVPPGELERRRDG